MLAILRILALSAIYILELRAQVIPENGAFSFSLEAISIKGDTDQYPIHIVHNSNSDFRGYFGHQTGSIFDYQIYFLKNDIIATRKFGAGTLNLFKGKNSKLPNELEKLDLFQWANKEILAGNTTNKIKNESYSSTLLGNETIRFDNDYAILVSDSDQSKYYFDRNTNLLKIIEKNKLKIEIEYKEKRPGKISVNGIHSYNFEVNSDGLITKLSTIDNSNSVSFGYKDGKISSLKNQNGLYSFHFNNLKKLISEIKYPDQTSFKVKFDISDRVIETVSRNQLVEQYFYEQEKKSDSFSRKFKIVQTINGEKNEIIEDRVFKYLPDQSYYLSQLKKSVGKQTSIYSYNKSGLLTSAQIDNNKFEFNYDTLGRPISRKKNGITEKIVYASSGSISSYQGPLGNYSYQKKGDIIEITNNKDVSIKAIAKNIDLPNQIFASIGKEKIKIVIHYDKDNKIKELAIDDKGKLKVENPILIEGKPFIDETHSMKKLINLSMSQYFEAIRPLKTDFSVVY